MVSGFIFSGISNIQYVHTCTLRIIKSEVWLATLPSQYCMCTVKLLSRNSLSALELLSPYGLSTVELLSRYSLSKVELRTIKVRR